MKRLWLVLVLALLLAFPALSAAQADDGNGGTTDWGSFFDANGNLLPGVKDLGVQTVEVPWMPQLPDWVPFDFSAKFHMYATETGATVLVPTASNLFFMALNPYESGLFNSEGQVALPLAWNIQGAAFTLSGAADLSPASVLQAIGEALGIPFTSELADAIINGQDAWSTISFWDAYNIFDKLWTLSTKDTALYTVFLLYSNCASSPVGCPPELAELMKKLAATNPPKVPNTQCQASRVEKGQISAKGIKTAPNYVLVTGQDPEKRGVDLRFELTISPTIYYYYLWEEVEDGQTCAAGAPVENCPADQLITLTHLECVEHKLAFCEPASNVRAQANLAESSRDWILNDLAKVYYGASLYHPDWVWTQGGSGGCDGSKTYRWQLSIPAVQVRDPGFYNLTVAGATDGTPVSEPRSFRITNGQFDAYLMETTIIQ